MSISQVFTNARLVLPDGVVPGSLHAVAGLIAAIDSPTHLAAAHDCEGDWLMPGFVEMHTDNFERHLMPRPKVQWAELPALVAHDAEVSAAGITTVFDALGVGDADPDSLRGSTWDGVVRTIDHADSAGLLRADHRLHVRCELPAPNTIDLFAPFRGHDRLGLISLMDHTPGQRQFRDMTQLKNYVCGKHGFSDAEFRDHIAAQKALSDRFATAHEQAAVTEARRFGAVLASHDDTTPDHVTQSAQHGATFAEFPTTVEAAQSCRDHGIAVMMGAPNLVRGGSHSGNVAAQALAQSDLLDIVSSDYVPSSLLSAALMLGDLWDDLPRGIATVTAAPAQAARLTDRGQIATGKRADLIRVRRFGTAGMLRSTWVEGRRVA